MDKTDYYEILGIDRSYPFTDSNDLKKKFRKLSVKLHPDKNLNDPNATENFQKLNTAYNVLSDPQKRMIYNRGGKDALQEMDRSNDENDDEPKVIRCKVTLAECYTGFTKEVEVNTKVLCQKCYGVGGKKDTSIACKKCNAQGIVEEKKQINHPIFGKVTAMTRNTCDSCSGKGFTFTEKCDCKEGFTELTDTIMFTQKKGIFRSMNQYPGKGDENKDGVRGMLVIVQELEDTSEFRIHPENRHLLFQKEISVVEALCGVDYSMVLPSGKTIEIKDNSNIISPDSCHLVENEGMPFTDNDIFGDLIITYTVKFPKNLSDSDREKLSGLGSSDKSPTENNVSFTDNNYQYLMNFDKSKGKKRNMENNNNRDSDSEDSEDNSPMGFGGMRFKMGSGIDLRDFLGSVGGMF
jgi:DnaJ-class molecular chaperone